MYKAVSDAWLAAHKDYLAPEGFVELTFHIPKANQTLVFTKTDLMSFSHTQYGCMLSSELPVNRIEFSLDNSDGKWNPYYPKGLYRYLSERLEITLRYGFDVLGDGVIEWIPGGTFYLSEWYVPSNGLEASFKARDAFEFLLNTPYTGEVTGTLYDLATAAFEQGLSDKGKIWTISETLKDYTVADIEYKGDESIAVILQKCANAAKCTLATYRGTIVYVMPVYYEKNYFTIPADLSYSYPEIEYSRPLKQVQVTYCNEQKLTVNYTSSGEIQTLENDFIATEAQAKEIALWVADALKTRMTISGEFRSDTRLDLFDVVDVESKYGLIKDVVITEITYTFTGAFRATYKGYVRGAGTIAELFSGEVYSGEVI